MHAHCMTKEIENWAEQYKFEDLRRLTHDRHELIAEIEAGDYVYLAAEIVMLREAFEELSPWDRCQARAMAQGMGADRAVVSGNSAARLWGIAVVGIEKFSELTYVWPTRPYKKSLWPPGIRYRSSRLSLDEVHEQHGVRVTKLSRTLIDVTRYYGLEAGVTAIDSARKLWPELTKEWLESVLCGMRPYQGKELVRKAIRWSVADSGSPLESRARAQILESGLVDPTEVTTQVPISLPGRSDPVFADIGVGPIVVVEVDGRVKYDGKTYGETTDDALRKERDREKAISNTGRIVIRTDFKALRRRPGGGSQFIDDLRDALRRAGQLVA